MDSRIGLDYIVENPEYTAKLAGALDTPNPTVKKQVLELLSALSVYSAEGYARALDALEHYKVLTGQRYRFNVIVSELRSASAVDYQTALVAFINCVIISTPQPKDRIRIRNEFIGLKLLPVLNDLRRVAASEPDLGVQLDVFDEQRENDEAQILQGPHGVDLNSHLDVFYAILRQVADTPQEIPFLSILQHLLRVDPREAVSDIVWDAAETLVHRATLLESRQDASRLLRSPSLQAKLCCHCHRGSDSRKQSLNAPLPPPPPPPPLGPPRVSSAGAPANKMGVPPMPPPLLNPPPASPACSPEPLENGGKLLPQQETPTPRTKMKTINWNKIPNHKVVGKNNIWSLVARSHQHSPMADLDWAEMEGLFCQQAPLAPSSQSSPRLGRDPQDPDRRRKESSEIALLDGKRSLNVNIFLKQFRSSNEDIIQLIRDGAHDDIGAEKLRGLLKILPEVDELEMLRCFDGDKMKLGNAEKFLLQLIEVPNYKLRIESMLLKEEFAANMGYLEPSINSMIVAGEDLMTNKPLQEVLYMVLVAGNFLNSGGYAGNAAGVKLSSLQKLTDIRANKPGMNLIHYVALQAEKKRTELLRFPEEMTTLEDATKTTVEQLQNEINALDSRIKKVRKEIDRPSTEKEIKMQMGEFLQMAEQEVSGLQRDMEELETMRKTLSEFFCEDSTTFKLEECFRVFHGFCVKFRQAVAENERRRIQEEQANARRRQREEQLAARRRQQMAGQPGSESECNLVDSLLYDIRSGFQQSKGLNGSSRDLRTRKVQNGGVTSEEDMSSITGSPLVARRRMGSFSGPTGEQAATNGREEGYSPDVTPNGSLRRRRSRVPSEEDDSNLMDFLRSSGHDGSRERKSWGSLDRSWARRARGSGGRKRPDLLSADFSDERERPSSPSPLLETKPVLPSTPEGESKPKAWRQKIEAWLQENEKEEKQNEELRRRSRRVQSNRRSLEADSESEGRGSTLDTLPEEKSTNTQYKRVYSDWRPTIEKTDVVGAMEAIEEAQPQTPVKDKSPWRKSNLNVPNSAEETELDMRRLRRMQSRGSVDAGSASSNPLQAIKEEDKRKGMICSLGDTSQEQDRLTLYLDPARSQLLHKYCNVPGDVLRSVVGEEPPTVPRRLRRPPREDQGDIDADNVETPPATRRRPAEPEEESLGDGQFDRFAAARRTRRYKKTSDYSSDRDEETLPVRRTEVVSPELVSEKQVIRPTTLHVTSVPVAEKSPEQAENTQTRLRKWQERLKYRGGGRDEDAALADIASAGRELQQLEQLRPARVSQRERIRSMIDPRQVEEALRCSRATPTVPEEKPVAERLNSEFIPEIKVNASTPSHVKGRSEHDLNDEGFEETQSLVSETPSQGTSSDAVDSPTKSKRRPGRIIRADSSGSSSSNTVPVASMPAATPTQTSAVASRTRLEPRGGLGRSSSVRGEGRVSVIPRRTASLRKTDSQASLSRRERSNSRTSLRSSRSSLNSAASVNTVKNAMSCTPPLSKSSSRSSVQGARLSGYTTAIKTLTSNLSKQPVHREVSSPTKKPLGPVQLKTSSQRSVPASRSSSSGSSIGPSVRRPRVTSGVSTSFKENATTTTGRPGSVPASRSSSSGSSVGPAVRRPVQQRNNLSFMRPTAASAAKDSIGSDATKMRKTVK